MGNREQRSPGKDTITSPDWALWEAGEFDPHLFLTLWREIHLTRESWSLDISNGFTTSDWHHGQKKGCQ